MLGEEHGKALVVADPSGVAVAEVGEMGREQGVQAVVGELPLQRLEANFLQNDVAVRIAENFLVNAIASRIAGIDEFKGRNAGLERDDFRRCNGAFLRRKNRVRW